MELETEKQERTRPSVAVHLHVGASLGNQTSRALGALSLTAGSGRPGLLRGQQFEDAQGSLCKKPVKSNRRGLSSGLALENGARGFVCEAKSSDFRVRFKELHSDTERYRDVVSL